MSRNWFNGQHPDDEGADERDVRVPAGEYRRVRAILESALDGSGSRWSAVAWGGGGVMITAGVIAALRPTRYPPLVTAGAATTAVSSVGYWLWLQRAKEALELMRMREAAGR